MADSMVALPRREVIWTRSQTMWKCLLMLTGLCLTFCATVCAEEPAAIDAYFPLTPGTTWKYLVTIKPDKGEPQMTAQTLTEETQKHAGKAQTAASDKAYAPHALVAYIFIGVSKPTMETLVDLPKTAPTTLNP